MKQTLTVRKIAPGVALDVAEVTLDTEWFQDGQLPTVINHPRGDWTAVLMEPTYGEPFYSIKTGYYMSMADIKE